MEGLVEEEHWVKLSTWSRRWGRTAARAELVPVGESMRTLGYASNELVVWWRCYGCGGFGNGEVWGTNLSFGGNGVGVELLCGLGEFNEGEANGLVGQCVNELGRVLCHVELLGSVAGMRAKHRERSSTRRGGSVIGLACDYDGEVTRRGSGEFRGLRLTARGPSHRRGVLECLAEACGSGAGDRGK